MLEISGIYKSYHRQNILAGVDLTVAPGECVGIVGYNGCGKTTLLRMIAGFNSIEGGDFYFNEERINDKEPSKRNIGMVFQNYAIFPHMTVAKNVAYGLKNRKTPKDEIARETDRFLEMMQIKQYADRLPENLSGGQQQRVALARALVIKPDVLLMDEPLSNLDAKLRMEMRQAIRKIQREVGITTVYVTHDQEEAMSLSHRIVVMNKGKFEQIGTPTEIYDKPATRHVASFIGEMNFIDKDDKTIAVRPEDVTVSIDGSGDFTGTVRTIMVLGHYVVVNVQHGDNVIKCFVDRDISEKLSVGQTVGMHIGKHTIFDK